MKIISSILLPFLLFVINWFYIPIKINVIKKETNKTDSLIYIIKNWIYTIFYSWFFFYYIIKNEYWRRGSIHFQAFTT
ncbi:hypothetical protein ABE48_22830 [Bacillus thuringiensis]|uniref:Uncharacterized protein n=1 Tax=Bacillus thuringiensis DB27 TaxID=1431339 RepID=W8ZAT3_BACTU|nr:hypothetical protein BtSCAC15_31575 [Bacillus thuringiensis]CDN39565.1 unnamed protein product [Bacillus thuringiensis DB27]MBG9519857.1 hypothetical protein [Bacillus thuringiensis]MBG9533930.1 hypothetical protein [Bacillus thuringiensis]MBG9633494.1 hypothetical protein [Bacillus thuringiensis]